MDREKSEVSHAEVHSFITVIIYFSVIFVTIGSAKRSNTRVDK